MAGKWPKKLPDFTEEQIRISADFMDAHLHAVQTSWYSFVENFNHGYPLRTYRPNISTLEIGAGIGAHLAYEKLEQQQYTAVELLPDLARQIQEKYPNVTVINGDVQKRLPLPDSSFDRVLAVHVLEHLPDLPAALREIHRVIKPDGIFGIVIPCEGGLATHMARNISARPHFEKKYGQSYDWFINSQHINMPNEITEEMAPLFSKIHSRWYPLLIPSVNLNLFVGMTLKPKK